MPTLTRSTLRRAAPLPPHERRAAIVHAVAPLLVDEGSSVTTRRLAEAAGVSEGTLFNVFSDKDELIAAVVDATVDPEAYERALNEIDVAMPFDDRLRAATELTSRRVITIWALVSRVDAHHQPEHRRLPDSPALIELMTDGHDRFRLPPTEAARHLRALTLALTHPMLSSEPHTADEIVDIFLNGVGT
ncbi:MAG: helix-turn-helix domain-containing protein [Ilumatobacteraceae bacterium]